MTIPILMAVNDRYAAALGVAVLSLLSQRRSGDAYDIRVLHAGLSRSAADRLEGLSCPGAAVRCVKIEPPDLPQTAGWISRETYFRLLAADVMAEYDKILYLDCDVIVLSDLAALYSRDLGEHLAAGVCDFRFDGSYAPRVLGIPTASYLNAGVLLINAALWRREGVAARCFAFLRENRGLEAYDQDAINFVCRGRLLTLEKEWNFQQVWPEIYNWHPRHAEFRRGAGVAAEEVFHFSGAGILHYVCDKKPWEYPEREFAEYFWRCARGSVFYETLLLSARRREPRPPLLARGWVCLREHGPAYTLRRLAEKLRERREG
jgi:Lipopolysaccharide biosynthesis proteins, LPS:glycosyltransferases